MITKPNRTILLIEDNPGDARLIREYLAEPDAVEFVLEWTALLSAGLARLAQGPVALVLLDLSLPDSVGLDTFTRLQTAAPELPIIVLSGQDDEALAIQTVHEGAQDYLVKGQGLDGRLLVRAIRYAIERKHAEEALAKERDLLHMLLSSLPDRIYFKDAQSRFLRISRAVAEQFRIGQPSEAIGKTDFDFFAREHAEAARRDEQLIMASGQPILGKIEKETLPDGHVTWALTTKLPLRDKQGRTIGTFGISRDVTELKNFEDALAAERNLLHQANVELGRKQLELQQALAQLQKSHAELKAAQFQLIQAEKMQSLGRLAAGVAHEVKNPLAILDMGIEYLAKNLASPDENVALILADMTEACKRADTILKDMLDFSTPRALDLQAENLNDLIDHSLGLLRQHLSTNAIRVIRDLAPLPPLPLDRNKIQQVFLNLLANAIQAMPQGGTLTVRTYTRELAPGEIDSDAQQRFGDRFRAGETVVVAEVRDTGCGIPEDKLAKIFDPFFTTKPTGNGLGLTVAKKIIELHAGNVEIHNQTGGGVIVTLWFKI